MLNRLKEFEKLSMVGSMENNPPVLRETRVAQTISSLPTIMREDSIRREQAAGYSLLNTETKSKFGINNGLWIEGKKVANFYYELEEVALLIEKDVSNIRGYSISVKVHVFKQQKEETRQFKNVSKEMLESVEFLNRVPFAVPEDNVSKSDFKQILYLYVNRLLADYVGDVTYISRSNGWLAYQGDMVYVDGEKAIGLPTAPVKSIQGSVIHNYKNVSDLWEQFQTMRHVLREPGHMEALLLYVFMSYSYTLFKQCKKTLKHSLVVVGPRGTRKTAVALCFSQLFEKETPKFNFLATESGLQVHLQDYQDACMLLDDLAPSVNSSKRAASEQKLETILRLMGDGGSRVINPFFANTTKDLKYAACGGMLITGEYFYSAGVESSIARALVVEINKESVDLQGLSYYQANSQILETMIARYLEFVSTNWEQLREVLFNVATVIRNKYQCVFSNGRYADYMGQYVAQAELLFEFFKVTEGISEVEINRVRHEIEQNMLCLLEANDMKMKTRAPIYTVLMSILNLVEEGKCFPWGTPMPRESLCLLENEEAYYVKQKDLADIVKTYCVKTGEPYVKMTTQELGKVLFQDAICTVYNEGQEKRLSKKYTQYGNQRLMELSKVKIQNYMGKFRN